MYKKFMLASTLLVTPYIISMTDAQAAKVDTTAYNYFDDVTNGSSHAANIYTLYRMGVVNGYGNGTYGTNESVSRQHIVAMMHRLIGTKATTIRPAVEFKDVSKSHPYYTEITWAYRIGLIDGSKNSKGELLFNPSDSMTRAQMAKILTNAFEFKSGVNHSFRDVKESDWAYEYINALYNENITRLENFTYNPAQNVTRGQLASFLVRAIEAEKKYNIGINYVREVPKVDKIDKTLESFDSGFGFTWKAEVKGKTLHLYGVNSKNQTIANYVKGEGKTLDGIKIGSTRATVDKQVGSYKVNYIDYKNGRISVIHGDLDKEILTINKDGKITRIFFDVHNNNKVTAILSMPVETYKNKDYYAKNTTSLRNSSEALMNLLINQSRKEFNLPELGNKNSSYGLLARNYSQYMIDKNYFAHESPDGKSTLMSRFKEYNIPNLYYMGENIAFGQETAIHAHEALMNSIGHRNNILSTSFKYTLTGTAFKTDNTPYYTINFYSTY